MSNKPFCPEDKLAREEVKELLKKSSFEQLWNNIAKPIYENVEIAMLNRYQEQRLPSTREKIAIFSEVNKKRNSNYGIARPYQPYKFPSIPLPPSKEQIKFSEWVDKYRKQSKISEEVNVLYDECMSWKPRTPQGGRK